MNPNGDGEPQKAFGLRKYFCYRINTIDRRWYRKYRRFDQFLLHCIYVRKTNIDPWKPYVCFDRRKRIVTFRYQIFISMYAHTRKRPCCFHLPVIAMCKYTNDFLLVPPSEVINLCGDQMRDRQLQIRAVDKQRKEPTQQIIIQK